MFYFCLVIENGRMNIAALHKTISTCLDRPLQKISQVYKIKARALEIKNPQVGAITFIQRFGSSLASNLHFHILFADGVFERQNFKYISFPTDEDLLCTLDKIKIAINKCLDKLGLLEDGEYPDTYDEDSMMSHIAGASVSNVIGLGDRSGKPVMKLKGADPPKPFKATLCVIKDGFSIHANTRIGAKKRDQLQKLICYTARPCLSQDRLFETPDGLIGYRLKRKFSDGTTCVFFKPIELIEKLVALVPPKYSNQTRYVGIFSPNAKDRNLVIPKPKVTKNLHGKDKQKGKSYIPWAELLRKTFKVEVLNCDNCGHLMEVIAVIQEKKAIEAILNCIGEPILSTKPNAPRAPPSQTDFDSNVDHSFFDSIL
jgi:hypothetical protein